MTGQMCSVADCECLEAGAVGEGGMCLNECIPRLRRDGVEWEGLELGHGGD